MRLSFFGSPDFALPSLEALAAAGHEVALVVSQPAKPVGRSAELLDPPVARRARELGLPVFQPPTLKDGAAVARLAEAGADLFVVVAYGKILAQRVLDLPRLGCVNVHGSVLPRWRGASPVQAALLAGDAESGVSIMRMEAGMDTGPVYAATRGPIAPEEDAGALSARLAREGAGLLVATLPGVADGTLVPAPQDDALATLCPKIRREDGQADFSRPAEELARRAAVRARRRPVTKPGNGPQRRDARKPPNPARRAPTTGGTRTTFRRTSSRPDAPSARARSDAERSHPGGHGQKAPETPRRGSGSERNAGLRTASTIRRAWYDSSRMGTWTPPSRKTSPTVMSRAASATSPIARASQAAPRACGPPGPAFPSASPIGAR